MARLLVIIKYSLSLVKAIINIIRNKPNIKQIETFGKGSPLGYDNAEMTRLLNLAGDIINPDEKDRIYEKIMAIFYEDMPVALLLPTVQTFVVHKRIKGRRNLYRVDPVWNMEHLWIEEQKK